MLNVISKRKIYLAISTVAVAAAFVLMGVWGFEQGIDFSGGTLWRFRVENSNTGEIQNFFAADLGITDAKVNQGSTPEDYLMRMSPKTEEEHRDFLEKLEQKFPSFEE